MPRTSPFSARGKKKRATVKKVVNKVKSYFKK